jgi:hypothetical protein
VDAKGHRASRTSTASIGATTSITRGRKNVFSALVGIDDQIQPGLKRKKYVLIKVNGLAPGRNIGSTNLDCLHGILDYLASRFKGPVVITEGGEATYKQAFEEFGWNTVAPEHKPMDIGFALLNDNQRYELMTGIDYDLHLVPIRLYVRLLDPDAFPNSRGPGRTATSASSMWASARATTTCTWEPSA